MEAPVARQNQDVCDRERRTTMVEQTDRRLVSCELRALGWFRNRRGRFEALGVRQRGNSNERQKEFVPLGLRPDSREGFSGASKGTRG
ncbi:uncharacterized [Tachysurus ichikawai]